MAQSSVNHELKNLLKAESVLVSKEVLAATSFVTMQVAKTPLRSAPPRSAR